MIEMEEVAKGLSSEEIKAGDIADWDEEESDDDIVLPAARWAKGEPKKKTTFASLMKDSGMRLGKTKMNIVVHNLSFSMDVNVTKTANNTVWQDLKERWWMDKKEKTTKKILRNVSFVIKEKMMVLLLGPTGCGKTSLMKLLANEMPYGHANGDLFFNKKEIDPDNHHQRVSYVTQEDTHTPFLTVRETLEFAGELLLNKKESGMENVKVADVAEIVMQLLGLSHRADTVVGNDMIRGLSGGEKKRVTIGIELMKRPNFLLLDEATTGLDTSRSVEIGKFCRIVADNHVPVFASLLQPPFKLYRRFDHILLLNDEGRVAYFGPRTKILEYFEGIGLKCPNWMNPADFLVAVMVRPDDFRCGEQQFVHSTQDFADVYAESSMYLDTILPMIRESYPDGLEPEEEPPIIRTKKPGPFSRLRSSVLETSFSRKGEKEEEEGIDCDLQEDIQLSSFSREKQESFISARSPNLTISPEIDSPPPRPPKFSASAFFQFKMLTKRGFQCTKNFPAMIIFLLVYSLVLALFYGTLFLQLGNNQIDLKLRSGIVFNLVLYIGFQASKSIDQLFQERPVFVMQRAKRYYSTVPYYFAGLVNTVPPLVMDVCLFASVAYWLIGLNDADGGGRFFVFLLIGILLQLACDGWLRFMSQLSRNYSTAEGLGPFSIGALMLFAGYFRKVGDIPWAFRWITYISPFRWAYEATIINELGGETFKCKSDELLPPTNAPGFDDSFADGGYDGNQVCPFTTGDEYLESLDLKTDQSWKWFCMLFLVILLVFFQFLAFLTLKFVTHEKPETPREKLKPKDEDREENEWL